jgi:hypothetical protein
MLAVPGAMESGVGDILFWGALSIALVIAGVVAYPVNRWLIARGRGHAVLHETGIHGGPPVRLVAFVVAAMAVFGTAVLAGEAIGGGGDEAEHGGGHSAAAPSEERAEHGGSRDKADPVRGLAVAERGLRLEPEVRELPRGRRTSFAFEIVGSDGEPVRDFEVEHDKRMHLIVARRDLTGFQHLHPELSSDGRWRTDIELEEAGSYRVFADFKRAGENHTLAADVAVDGPLDSRPMAPPATRADAKDGYGVELADRALRAGEEAELAFEVSRAGEMIEVDDYLGAKGHLVALREGDLAYLHVHPSDGGHGGGREERVSFATEFPSAGRYGLFLQFKHEGKVRTAAFTREVAR